MKKVLIGLVSLLILLFIDGRLIEPNNFKVYEHEIKNEAIVDSFRGFKIVHISDLLFNENRKIEYLEKIVNSINERKPDIIIFTGDLIDNKYNLKEDEQSSIIDTLSKLECTLYKYAIIGDNDNDNLDLYRNIIEQSGFKLLNNTKEYIFYKDINPLKIVGINSLENLDDIFTDEENIIPFYTIAITHFPNNIDDISNYNPNLILAGHSLGGIIKVPFYGNLIKKENANKYPYDSLKVKSSEVYISNGLGQEDFDFRLLNTPSYNIYRLEK